MDIALKKKNVYNPVEVMNMSKEVKTNAMRMLDKHHIRYDMIQYECDEFMGNRIFLLFFTRQIRRICTRI